MSPGGTKIFLTLTPKKNHISADFSTKFGVKRAIFDLALHISGGLRGNPNDNIIRVVLTMGLSFGGADF